MSRRTSLLSKVVPDWSWGPGTSPTTGAIITAAGSAAGAMSAVCIDAPVWSVGIAGAAVATVAAARAARNEQPWRVIAYRAGAWLAGTGWATTSVALASHEVLMGTGPWSVEMVSALAAGTAGFTMVGAVLARIQKRIDALAALEHAPEEIDFDATDEDKIAQVWGDLIRRVTNIKGITIRNVEPWEGGKGFTLDCDLPLTGVTVTDVKGYEFNLATAANLPVGCNIEINPSDIGRASFTVRVATVNCLRDNYVPERDFSVCSIFEPISLGKCSDGSDRTIVVNYKTSVMIGQKDSGKSTGLNTIMRQIVRCNDAIIVGIDTTGKGRAFRWAVRPFFEGRAARPAVNMVAADDETAILACQGIRHMIANRTADYQELMFKQNSDKIVPTPDVPAVVVIVDEYGTLSDRVKAALVDLSDTGRGAGVAVLICALRAKAPYLTRDMLAQAYNRIAYRVSDEAELQMLFDSTWSRGRFDPSSMPYPGVGCVVEGASPADTFKGWIQDPQELDALAVAVGDRAPLLDAKSAARLDEPEGMGGLYAKRWDHTLPLMFPGAKGGTGRTVSAPAQGGGTVTQERTRPVASMEETEAAMREAVAAAKAAREAADAEYAAELEANSANPDRAAEVAALNALYISSPDVDPRAMPSHPTAPKVESYERVYQLLKAAYPGGLGASEIHRTLHAEGRPTSLSTVQGWLKRDEVKGLLSQESERKPYIYVPREDESSD